jgi:hypothetical protein
MNKNEASAVLHEIFDLFKESTIIDILSLDLKETASKISESFQIKVKCNLENNSKIKLTTILRKHKLEMTEEKGFLILYSKL